MKNKWSTFLLQLIISFLTLLSLFLLFYAIPSYGSTIAETNPEVAFLFFPAYSFVLVSALPFYVVLYLSFQLVTNIGNHNIFIEKNSHYLKYINRLAIIEMILYLLPLFYLSIHRILAPGVFILLAGVLLIAITIAGMTYVFKNIIDQAVLLNRENELII